MGQNIEKMKSHQISKQGIAQCLEGRHVFAQLSVAENLMMGAFLRPAAKESQRDLEYVYSLFPRLKERERQLAGTLSGGEQQMLAVGRALMQHPQLLMMDEPSLGLAPRVISDIFQTIQKINQDGMTILLVEQNSNAALQIAHRGYVMETAARWRAPQRNCVAMVRSRRAIWDKSEGGLAVDRLKYAISITDEPVGVNTPVMFHGTFGKCFRAAADCGYDGVELQIKDPATRNVKALLELMKTYHLAIPAITTGMEYFGNGLSMISDDPDIQRKAVDRLIEYVHLAAEVGGMVLFAPCGALLMTFPAMMSWRRVNQKTCRKSRWRQSTGAWMWCLNPSISTSSITSTVWTRARPLCGRWTPAGFG